MPKQGKGASKPFVPNRGTTPQPLAGPDKARRHNPPGLGGSGPNITRVRGTALGYGVQDISSDPARRLNPPAP
jgi:hypothetical protein